MHSSAKKFFLVGFIVLLLVGIPVSVYFLQQQQITTQQAEQSTIFSFSPDSTETNPITKTVGDTISLDVMVNPGKNAVTSVTLEINYDADKLEVASGSFVPDPINFPTLLSGGPVYTPGKIVASIGISSPDKAITTITKAATITFKALAPTDNGAPTSIAYTGNNIATSNGGNDQVLENVFSSQIPAFIAISAASEPTATPTTIPTETPTAGPTAVPSDTPTPTTTTTNQAASCTTLGADQTSGAAPLTVNFTANGTDSDGSISKVTFNFGDGQVSDVTTGGGIGTNNVNVQLAHTYTTGGTFQASALLTDNSNGVSATGNCTQTISVSGDAAASATPTPPIAATGSTEVLFGVGVASFLLILGGALIFFVL